MLNQSAIRYINQFASDNNLLCGFGSVTDFLKDVARRDNSKCLCLSEKDMQETCRLVSCLNEIKKSYWYVFNYSE